MSGRTKIIGLMILAQAGCVGVGLWVQQHYYVNSVSQEAEEAMWSEMSIRAKSFLTELNSSFLTGTEGKGRRLEQIKVLLEDKYIQDEEVIIVDQKWRVVDVVGNVDQESALHMPRGHHISWTRLANKPFMSNEPIWGRLDIPGNPRLAVACPFKKEVYILFQGSPEEATLSPAKLVESFPIMGVVTLIWICTPLAIIAYMILAHFYDRIEHERERTVTGAMHQIEALVRTRDAIIFGLAKLTDSRDPETGDHLERIAAYSTILASSLRAHPKYREQISPTFVRLIGISCALHDIGKVGIEDRILKKRNPLTTSERLRMQEHVTIGGQCLEQMEMRLGSTNFLQMAREIAFAHHERWDGTGYPRNLVGEDIPLSARIVAIADAYDALSTKRVYKDAISHENCVDIIYQEAGIHFDPTMVEVFLEIEQKFLDIAQRYRDASTDERDAVRSDGEYLLEKEADHESEHLAVFPASGES